MNVFYLDIEETIRPYVKELRDNGINTTCSCEHEGYIEAESNDPSTEQRHIFDVMTTMGVKEWAATLHVQHSPSYWYSRWEIKSPDFIKESLREKKDE
jgi:hypothetical protein